MSDNAHAPERTADDKPPVTGIVSDPGLAERIAELLLEAHYGKDQVSRQKPLTITDKGDYWQIDGSWNRDRKIEGEGPFFLSILKRDGRVIDLAIPYVYHAHPDAMAFIQASLRRHPRGDQPTTFPDLYPAGRMLELINMARGGVIYDAKTARRLAELLLGAHDDDADVGHQHPLIVNDKGDHWQIDGGRHGRSTGISIALKKYDARVADFRKSGA